MEKDELIAKEVLWPDTSPASGRKECVLFTNCFQRMLVPFLLASPEFRTTYNVTALETGPIVLNHLNPVNCPEMSRVLQRADVLLTYNTGPRMGEIRLDCLRERTDARIITFTAANFSAFWPFAYGFGGSYAIAEALDRGQSPEDVWQDFLAGRFDPAFKVRFRLEIGRLGDRDAFHDIGLAQFILSNYKDQKLFMSSSHPTSAVVEYVGNEILKRLGFAPYGGSVEALNGQPETDYEFAYYGFTYPKKFSQGVEQYYRPVFDHTVKMWKAEAFGFGHPME